MPNIGAFIAWGYYHHVFIPTGWLLTKRWRNWLVDDPAYLLPLLIPRLYRRSSGWRRTRRRGERYHYHGRYCRREICRVPWLDDRRSVEGGYCIKIRQLPRG